MNKINRRWQSVVYGLLMVVGMACSLPAMADDHVLQVWQADGTVMNIKLSDEPKTSYQNGNLVIKTANNTITLPLETVKKYTYATLPTGISTPKAVEASFSSNGETLTLSGLKIGSTVELYNAAGQLLKTITIAQQGSTVVSVSQFPYGVYVVKANGVTYKLLKR